METLHDQARLPDLLGFGLGRAEVLVDGEIPPGPTSWRGREEAGVPHFACPLLKLKPKTQDLNLASCFGNWAKVPSIISESFLLMIG